jgi:hypothetical protein
MATINTRLLPFRDYDEHEVLGFFALNQTGVAGQFVSFSTFDPDNQKGFSSVSPGADYDNVYSKRYEVKAKVAPAASGTKASQVAGITLYSTLEFDENGEKLIFHPEKKDKLKAVTSGEGVPILKRGLVTLTQGAYLGTPAPGSYGVISPSGDGKILAVSATGLVTTGVGYKLDDVVGRFISSAGTKQGGYALFEVSV